MTTAVMSEAQLRTHYAGIKARLFNSKPRPANLNAKPAPLAEVVPIKARQMPMWEQGCQFDAHVIAYRSWLVNEVKRLNDDYEEHPRKPVKDIISEVLAEHPLYTVADLKSKRRSRDLVMVRHIAMYELRMQRPDLSFPQIGRFLGGFDHTSVLHAVNRIAALRAAAE